MLVSVVGSSPLQQGSQGVKGQAQEGEETQKNSRAVHHAQCYRRRVWFIFDLQNKASGLE
jgi:hypothetical protein